MNQHRDNTNKDGFSALETLGQIDPEHATFFTYERADGTQGKLLDRYPEVDHETRFFLQEDLPGILHSSYSVKNFYFADRIDEFAVVDPGNEALFVDVGDHDMCGIEFLDGALELEGIPWQNTSVFITHSHDDHDGNAVYCLDRGAKCVYMGALRPYDEAMTAGFLRATGVDRSGDEDIAFYVTRLLKRDNQFTGYEDCIRTVHAGDTIDVGEYHLEALETPGHTLEHLCLVDKEKKILFAGDHILETAPGLMSFFVDSHLLERFLASFAYLESLGLERVFMCHREPLVGTENINAFMEGIVRSYDRPVNKMLSMLESQPLTVYQLAQKYYAYLESWEDQPTILMTRRIAIAFTYLEYLHDTGRALRREAADGALEYSLA